MSKTPILKNPNREVYEGNTVQWFHDEMAWQVRMVMEGQSRFKPFETKSEIREWLGNYQPYVKKAIPELVNYFSQLYNLK